MCKKDCYSIARCVSEIHRAGNIFFSKAYEKYNIGAGQYAFLRMLYFNDGVTQEDLSIQLNVDKATAARAICKLEKEGYVYREKDSNDKRANNVYLTEKALSIKEEFFDIHKKWDSIITEGLSKQEEEMALAVLKKIAQSDAVRR